MAIKISGNTVIDDSQNITNITNVTASGTISGGIIATTAEAQAATADDVIMTPAKVKELLQGGNASVVKRVIRISAFMGIHPTVNGYNWGSVFRLGSTGSVGINGGVITSSTGGVSFYEPSGWSSVLQYCFVSLGVTVDPNKSFLTVQSPLSPTTNEGSGYQIQTNTVARFLDPSTGAFPSGSTANYLQLFCPYPILYNANYDINTTDHVRPQVQVEVVEFY